MSAELASARLGTARARAAPRHQGSGSQGRPVHTPQPWSGRRRAPANPGACAALPVIRLGQALVSKACRPTEVVEAGPGVAIGLWAVAAGIDRVAISHQGRCVGRWPFWGRRLAQWWPRVPLGSLALAVCSCRGLPVRLSSVVPVVGCRILPAIPGGFAGRDARRRRPAPHLRQRSGTGIVS